MSGVDPHNGPASIEDVLQLIDAQPIPDVDELAAMSMAEIERQLADLGVDTDAQVSELLDRLESPSMTPLAGMSVQDLEQLSLDRVERQLAAEGVDVRTWLSRAETLIRNARGRALMEQPRADSSAAPVLGSRANTGQPDSSRRIARPRRRLPQALVASVVMVAIAGLTFSILDQPELDSAVPTLAVEGPSPAPTVEQFAMELPGYRQRENAQPPQVSQSQDDVGHGGTASGEPPAENLVDAVKDMPLVVDNAPRRSVDEGLSVPAMVRPEPLPSPSAPTVVLSAEAEVLPETRSSVVARLVAPPAATHKTKPSMKSREIDRLASNPALDAGAAGPDEQSTAVAALRADGPSRIASASADAQFEARLEANSRVADGAAEPTALFRAQEPSLKSLGVEPRMSKGALAAGASEADQVGPNVANPPADIASRKRMIASRSAAPIATVPQNRAAPVSAPVADRVLATVHEVRAGQTLAASLLGLPLAKAEQEALARVFSAVDLTRGAILRLSVSGNEVQSATLVLPQGRSVSAIRNERGGLVLER